MDFLTKLMDESHRLCNLRLEYDKVMLLLREVRPNTGERALASSRRIGRMARQIKIKLNSVGSAIPSPNQVRAHLRRGLMDWEQQELMEHENYMIQATTLTGQHTYLMLKNIVDVQRIIYHRALASIHVLRMQELRDLKDKIWFWQKNVCISVSTCIASIIALKVYHLPTQYMAIPFIASFVSAYVCLAMAADNRETYNRVSTKNRKTMAHIRRLEELNEQPFQK